MSQTKIKTDANFLLGKKLLLTLTFVLFGFLASAIIYTPRPALAAVGINEQMNYQARLLTSSGATVADGNYNIRFKIYQDGNGVLGGGDETLLWTEKWQNSNSQGVTVKNGYFSVQLGSICAFTGGSCQGTTNTAIDWNQSVIWLSIDVGQGADATSSAANPTYDGEMSPFKRLSANPYALNSKYLGGIAASGFVQLQGSTPGVQQTGNLNVSGTVIGATLIQSAALDAASSGTLAIGNGGNATTLSLCNAANCDTIQIGTNTDADTITIGDAANDTVGINGTTTTITGSTTGLATTLVVNNSTSTGKPIDVQDNGTSVFNISDGGAALFKNAVNSASAFQIQNAAGSSKVFNVDTTNSRIGIGTDAPNHKLDLRRASSAVEQSICFCNDSGNDFLIKNVTGADDLHFQSQAGDSLFALTQAGAATFKNSSNSATAFQIQNAAATTTVLNADTSAGRIGIGTASPDARLDVEASEDTESIRLTDSTNGDSSGIFTGDGSPEGVVTAQLGSIYTDHANGKIYRKASGDGTNTGWEELVSGSGTHTAKMARAAAQTLTASGTDKILFDTEEWDVGSIADPTTNDRFDIKKAGKYLVTASLRLPGLDSGKVLQPLIYKNGVAVRDNFAYSAAAAAIVEAQNVDVLDLAVGDYIEFYVFHNGTANQNTDIDVDERPVMTVTQLDAAGGGNPEIAVRAYNSADATIANNTVTPVTFNSERYDTANLHSTSSNTSRLTAGTKGKYIITGHCAWNTSASATRRICDIRLNGSTFIARSENTPPASSQIAQTVTTIYELNAGDYVELTVYQNTGGNLTLWGSEGGGTTPNFSQEFMMTKIDGGVNSTLQAAYNSGNTLTTTDNRDISIALADTATDSSLIVNLQGAGDFKIQDAGTDVFRVNDDGTVLLDYDSTASAATVINLLAQGTQTVANTGTYYAADFAPSYTAASGTLAGLVGVLSNPVNANAGTVTNLYGFYGLPQSTSSGPTTSMYGVLAIPQKTGTGAVTSAFGLYSRIDNTNASGAITNAYGLYIADSTETGTITNDYGVYQADTGASNVFAGGTVFEGTVLGDASVCATALDNATCISLGDGAAGYDVEVNDDLYVQDAVFAVGNVSALSFTDRTAYPETLQQAYGAVQSMQRLPDGQYDPNNEELQLDHSKLDPFITAIDEQGNITRNLSASVSAINEVTKDLITRIETLELQDASGEPQQASGDTASFVTLTVSGQATVETLTVSGNAIFDGPTLTLGENTRGIDVALIALTSTTHIAFATPHDTAGYAVWCTPNFNTTCFATNKQTTGFDLNFGTPAPADGSGRFDWLVIR